MAHNFQKIYAPFGRSKPNDRLVEQGNFSREWVRMYFEGNIRIYASEKIDGTSVGIVWDGERVSFVGHTDKSKFCPRYLEYLEGRFGTPEFESMLEMIFGERPVTIYGEGISKDYNEDYGFPEGNFIMYDIANASGKFFNRECVKDIASKLDIIYPHEEMITIPEAIKFVSSKPRSFLNDNAKLERLVLRSPLELYTNNDERVICKVKVRDFV